MGVVLGGRKYRSEEFEEVRPTTSARPIPPLCIDSLVSTEKLGSEEEVFPRENRRQDSTVKFRLSSDFQCRSR